MPITSVTHYRFLLLRDKLWYGWRPKGRYHLSPDDVAKQHNINTDKIEVDFDLLPRGEIHRDYTLEWIAGVYDGLCRYRLNIAKSSELRIGYGMYPTARFHKSGISSEFVTHFLRFCSDYNIPYGDSSGTNRLRLVFSGASNIRRILDVLFPHLLVLYEASETLVDTILPRFDKSRHRSKQGFYHLLRDFDPVAEASGGPFRHRNYDPAYFADQWHDELDLIEEDTQVSVPESTPIEVPTEINDITLSVDHFENEPGRYHTIVDRIQRDSGIVAKLKSIYNDRCQLCGARLARGDGTGYSEVHHIRPLGAPHSGPDTLENMLVLCPNHHADFDNGVIGIDVSDFSIEHPYDSEINGESLFIESKHRPSKEIIQYHNQNICNISDYQTRSL
jgi:hypothetical protein